MADSMDLVQQRVEEERQRHIHTARSKEPGVSRVLCIECDAPIPPCSYSTPVVVFAFQLCDFLTGDAALHAGKRTAASGRDWRITFDA